MFTGIVEATGVVRTVDDGGRRVVVDCGFARELEVGQSVSVDGACLTVEDHDNEGFEVHVSGETRERTTLSDVREGDVVNLERAMPADGRFDGHVVQGHVDDVVEVVDVRGEDGDWTYSFGIPRDQDAFVVEKGSVALDGVSLTVAAIDGDRFSVAVIPETRRKTTFDGLSAGDRVNFEADVLAKYVESAASSYLER